MKCQLLFFWKNKKNTMNLSSAEFAHSVKTGLYFGTSLGDSLHGMSNAIFWEK